VKFFLRGFWPHTGETQTHGPEIYESGGDSILVFIFWAMQGELEEGFLDEFPSIFVGLEGRYNL
jgi:hypothetical protein